MFKSNCFEMGVKTTIFGLAMIGVSYAATAFETEVSTIRNIILGTSFNAFLSVGFAVTSWPVYKSKGAVGVGALAGACLAIQIIASKISDGTFPTWFKG